MSYLGKINIALESFVQVTVLQCHVRWFAESLPDLNIYTGYAGLGSITIVIDCNRLQLERSCNCNRNQIFQIVA